MKWDRTVGEGPTDKGVNWDVIGWVYCYEPGKPGRLMWIYLPADISQKIKDGHMIVYSEKLVNDHTWR
jgi:hypothetical protein